MQVCARLKRIEEMMSGPEGQAFMDDSEWMIAQIRSWQAFAKRVVDYGDVLRRPQVSVEDLTKEYEKLFAAPKVT